MTRSLLEGSEPLEASEGYTWPELGAIGSPISRAQPVGAGFASNDDLPVSLRRSPCPALLTLTTQDPGIHDWYSLADIPPRFDADPFPRHIWTGITNTPPPSPSLWGIAGQMAIDSPPSDDEHQHSSEAYTSDVSDDTSFDPVYPRRGRRSPSSPNPYRPSVPVHPASRPLHDLTPDPGNDWELTSLSQLTPVELTQLITSAGLRVWEDLGGALLLCESDGETRAELPWARARRCNGPTLPLFYFEDAWRRVNPGTATRTEIVELLVASRLCVQENSMGNLRLTEWSGRVRAILHDPIQHSRRSPVA